MDEVKVNNTKDYDEKQCKKQCDFERLAEPRVTEAIHRLELVGKLGNRNSYYYDKEQVQKIFQVIDDAVAEMKEKFVAKEKTGRKAFSFKNE